MLGLPAYHPRPPPEIITSPYATQTDSTQNKPYFGVPSPIQNITGRNIMEREDGVKVQRGSGHTVFKAPNHQAKKRKRRQRRERSQDRVQ
jgi:hypothetical protein